MARRWARIIFEMLLLGMLTSIGMSQEEVACAWVCLRPGHEADGRVFLGTQTAGCLTECQDACVSLGKGYCVELTPEETQAYLDCMDAAADEAKRQMAQEPPTLFEGTLAEWEAYKKVLLRAAEQVRYSPKRLGNDYRLPQDVGAYVYEGFLGGYHIAEPRIDSNWVAGNDTSYHGRTIVGHIQGIRSKSGDPSAGTVSAQRMSNGRARTRVAGHLITNVLVAPDGSTVLYGGDDDLTSAFCIGLEGAQGCKEVLRDLTNLLQKTNCQP